MSKKIKPKNIADYIKSAPVEARSKLREMRTCIRAAAPGSVEALKWGIPAFSHHRILVAFAGFKHHIGFYPTPSILKLFSKELSKYKTGKGSVQFPLRDRLPLGLIRKMTKARVRQSLDEDKRWM